MADKLKILLIEDNPGDARLLNIFLDEVFGKNFSLTICDNLANSIKKINSEAFDIVIADLSLPDSEGLDTFQKIHKNVATTPVIVLTGLEDESVGINAMKLGAQDFLIKGQLKSKEIKRSIDYSIERHKLLKELAEKAEELQQKSDDLFKEQLKLKEAQKLSHIGSWELDFRDFSFKCSEELYRIYGIDPATFIPTIHNFLSYIHPEDRERIFEVVKNYSFVQQQNFQYRIIRSDGEMRTISGKGEPMFDNDKRLVRIIGTAQDITEHLHEEELEKLVLAATKSFNSVVITDQYGNIEWVNEGFTKLTGFTAESLKNISSIVKANNKDEITQLQNYYTAIQKDKKPITYEHKNVSKDGKDFWVITTLTPVLGKTGEVERVISIDSDISIRKQMEEELLLANRISEHLLRKGNKALNDLLKAQKELKETMKVKEQFLANMSHEIRTPMNAIVGFTELLIKTKLTDEQHQYIEAIKTSGQNLLVIINDILDFSKLQAGKFVFEQINIDLHDMITKLIDLSLPKTLQKNIKIIAKIDTQIPNCLLGDPTRLNQILLNLISNAIKFTEAGEIKIKIDLVNETKNTINLHFSIQDTGIGIPSDKLDMIFEGFTQAKSSTTRKYGGTGLGLAIVKQLIEQQGGHIEVKSEEGKGSFFNFKLAFKKGDKQQINKQNNLLAPTAINLEKKIENIHVLLVEDNSLNQLLASKVLSGWNWTVDTAENGIIAVNKVQINDYDVVLMDIQMPEMDGYEATRYIRTNFSQPKSHIPIVAMTAHAINGEIERCEQAGMNAYISKPFNEDTLYSTIITTLNNNKKTLSNTKNLSAKSIHLVEDKKYTDLTYLKQLSKGDNEFVKNMISIFINQTPSAIQKMEKDLNNKDWTSLKALAHKMKPSFSFIGISNMKEKIEIIEQHAKQEQNPELIASIIAEVKDVSLKAINELQTLKEL